MKDGFYISSQNDLKILLDKIEQKKVLAIDTEFTRQNTYFPILSIIQIALTDSENNKEIFIIDCQCGLDLKGFMRVIADKNIVKIFHSCSQDLQIFYEEFKVFPQRIFDTQLMANFCGFGFGVGYSNLVEKIFEIKISKKEQRSDWQKRPLSEKQLKYAALDVFYLEEIYQKFCEILQERGFENWNLQESELFVKKLFSKSEDGLLKSFSLKNRTAKEVFELKNILSWREEWAKKTNLPRRHFLEDEAVERIIKGDFSVFEGNKKYSEKALLELKEALLKEYENWQKDFEKRVFSMTQKQIACYDEAKKMISKIANKNDFREGFLITSSDLKKIIHNKDLFDKIIFGWRFELFGQKLKELIELT